jgi:hypothetical protein
MNRIVLPAVASIAILFAAGGAAFALTGGADDETANGRIEAAENDGDGEDTGGDGVSQPDGGGGGAAGICAEGTVDCNDTPGDLPAVDGDPEAPVSHPAEPPYGGDGDAVNPAACTADNDYEPCKSQAVALAIEDAAGRFGREPVLVSVEYVQWPDASLGNPQPGMAYAEVITPGFRIILTTGGDSGWWQDHPAELQYHTDLAGNLSFVD